MKITQRIILIISTAFFFLSASCDKQDPEPEFTQGFSCKINGEEWIAKTPASISGPVAVYASYIEESGQFNLTGSKKEPDQNIDQSIYIYIYKGVNSQGKYTMSTLNGDGGEIVSFLSVSGNTGCAGYLHDTLNPGTLEICTFDQEKREMSGTFNMTLINRDCTDSLMHITDGKFAFRY